LSSSSQARKQKALKIQKQFWPGIWLAKPKSWPSSFHFPSSIVVCSLFPSITASLENIIAEPEGKETKQTKAIRPS
jgi:hypothetical protein